MKSAIPGAGAMGGIFRGSPPQAGEGLAVVFNPRPRPSTPAEFRSRKTSDPGAAGVVDLIRNFVKCHHREAAVSAAREVDA